VAGQHLFGNKQKLKAKIFNTTNTLAMKKMTTCIAALSLLQATTVQAQKWSEKINGAISTVTNTNGQTLGYSTTSGVKLITVDGLAFKDLNKNGKLDKYEDWRLPADTRAKDLASKMSVEQIAGLMLYSRHQPVPVGARGPFAGTYNGKVFTESGAKASDLSDQQKDFLTKETIISTRR
jgi:beta-glucosidase